MLKSSNMVNLRERERIFWPKAIESIGTSTFFLPYLAFIFMLIDGAARNFFLQSGIDRREIDSDAAGIKPEPCFHNSMASRFHIECKTSFFLNQCVLSLLRLKLDG